MVTGEGKEPLVSVVTPAYNEENYLAANLKSVSRQDHPNIEHIVVDDGSTDRTLEILRSHQNEYELKIVSQKNEGLPGAVNTGFSLASGDIVIWLNADDVLCRTDTVASISELMTEEEADVVYGPNLKIGPDNEILGVRTPDLGFSYRKLKNRMFASFIVFDGEIIRRHSLDTEYRYAPDYEFALRLAREGATFSYLDSPIFAHRVHAERITDQRSDEMQAEGERCKREHGQELDATYRAYRFAKINLLRVLGLKHVYSIHADSDKLAFEIDLDSLPASFKAQLSTLYTPF